MSITTKSQEFTGYLQLDMRRRKYGYLGAAAIVFICMLWLFFTPDHKEIHFSERVKISLRDVGNQLLLEHQDSTLTIPLVAPSNVYPRSLSIPK